MEGTIQDLVDQLATPGFFDDLDKVVDWFAELYKLETAPASTPKINRFASRVGFPAHLVLEHFGKHGLTPSKHAGEALEGTRSIYNEYIIGQLLEDVCGLNENAPAGMLGNRITMLIERRNQCYPK